MSRKKSMPQIVEVPIGDLKPYENNPRFNEDAVPAVMESLRQFGWQQPVVIAARLGNEIVAGHTRVEAAKRLGMKAVPTVDASALTNDQIRAYRLADNKTNELASWDVFKLDTELAALPKFDMAAFGFKEDLDDDIAKAFGDDSEGAAYKDAGKITLKIPVEYMEQVRQWLRDGGLKQTARWLLVQSGCIGEDDEVPEIGEAEEEEED